MGDARGVDCLLLAITQSIVQTSPSISVWDAENLQDSCRKALVTWVQQNPEAAAIYAQMMVRSWKSVGIMADEVKETVLTHKPQWAPTELAEGR